MQKIVAIPLIILALIISGCTAPSSSVKVTDIIISDHNYNDAKLNVSAMLDVPSSMVDKSIPITVEMEKADQEGIYHLYTSGTVFREYAMPGPTLFTINIGGSSAGIYRVTVKAGDTMAMQNIIIENRLKN